MIRDILLKKGFVLVGVVGFSLLIILVIIPLIGWSVSEYNWTTRSLKSLEALNLADAGAEYAIWEIAHNNKNFTGWSGVNPKTITISSFRDNNMRVVGDITVSADETSLDHFNVVSTGFVRIAGNQIVRKRVHVQVFPKPLFHNAVFGNSSVSLSGIALVDSYDSSLGPYSSLTARSNGDVGSNNIISMVGSTSIKGDALIGPEGSTSGVETRITGEVFYSANPVELELPALPSFFSSVPLSPDIKITKDTTTLATGNYHFNNIDLSSTAILDINSNSNVYVSQSITTTAQARIITAANVKIYISGDANFAGQGILNTTGIPRNLEIIGLGSDTNISYAGGADFYGTIYAPESTVSISGGASIFGAIVGDVVTMSGTGTLHYDESLSEGGPTQGYAIAYWQED